MNCGLLALSKIKDLKGVSAFTLIHLAKDNGVDLKICKVKESDLPLVHRPAIFHSENHFEFIKNGEALPKQKWTGYVLTQKFIGISISHKEAKNIKGEGPVAAVVSAIVGAVSTIGNAVGAGVAGLAGGVTAANTAGVALGTAASLGTQGAIYGAAGGAALAGATGKSVGKGAALGASTGAGVGAGGAFGGALGFSGSQIGGAIGGAIGGKATGTGVLPGAAGGFLAGSLAPSLTSAARSLAPGTGTGQAAASGASATGSSGGFGLGNLGNLAGAAALSTAAKSLGPQGPKTIDFDPTKEFTTLRNIIGTQGLPPAAEKQILNDINTPIAELARQINPVSDRTIRLINQSYDLRDAQIRKDFAQAGQNSLNSSEAREELRRSQLDRATALGEAEQETFNKGVAQAIQSKQFALNRSIEANQFDIGIALELADLIGTKATFEAAIQQNDENQFNTILAQILNIGFGGDTRLTQIQNDIRALQEQKDRPTVTATF